MHKPDEYLLKVYSSFYLIFLLAIPVGLLCLALIPHPLIAMLATVLVSVALYYYLRACYLFYYDRIVIKRRFKKDMVILHRRISEAKFVEYRRRYTGIAIKHLHKGKETVTSLDVGYDGPSVQGLLLQQGINIAYKSVFPYN